MKPVISRKRGSAYGQWQVIKEVAMPDLQLPNDSSNFEVGHTQVVPSVLSNQSQQLSLPTPAVCTADIH